MEKNDCFNNVVQSNGTVIGYFLGNHPNPGFGGGGGPHPNLQPAGFGLHAETVTVPGLGTIHADATLGQYTGVLLLAGATTLAFFTGGILAAGVALLTGLEGQSMRDDVNAVYHDFQDFNNAMGTPYPHENFTPTEFNNLSSAAQVIGPMSPGTDNGVAETFEVGSSNQYCAYGSIGASGCYGGGSFFTDRTYYDQITHPSLTTSASGSFVMNSGLNT